MVIFGLHFDPFNKEKIRRLEIEKEYYQCKAEEYYKEYKRIYCLHKKFSNYGNSAEYLTNLYMNGKKYVTYLMENPVIPKDEVIMVTDRFDYELYNSCFKCGDGVKTFSELPFINLDINQMWKEKEKNPEIFLYKEK